MANANMLDSVFWGRRGCVGSKNKKQMSDKEPKMENL